MGLTYYYVKGAFLFGTETPPERKVVMKSVKGVYNKSRRCEFSQRRLIVYKICIKIEIPYNRAIWAG